MIAGDGRLELAPIGVFRAAARHKNEARRQGALDRSGDEGVVELASGRGFEEAVRDLDGFERVWLVYGFHLSAESWKPLVTPPRGPRVKRGVFATRAPYRPNPIGLTCARLLAVDGLRLRVSEHDLLDGTPIYDVKPYVAYADAFPEAAGGWTDGLDADAFAVEFAPEAEEQLAWLEAAGVARLREFLLGQLAHEPFDEKRKRVRRLGEARGEIAYRTWRAEFRLEEGAELRRALVERLRSGYGPEELAAEDDPYADKAVHRRFNSR